MMHPLPQGLNKEERELILKRFDDTYRDAIREGGPTDLELTYALLSRWQMYVPTQTELEDYREVLYQIFRS